MSVSVVTNTATNVTASTARLPYDITILSGSNPTVITLFYGLTNGGTNPALWDISIGLGSKGNGSFNFNISALLDERIYYWNIRSVNSAGTDWGVRPGGIALSQNFGTLGTTRTPDAWVGTKEEGGLRSIHDAPWGETICKNKLPAAHFGVIDKIVPLYAVTDSTLVSTITNGATGYTPSTSLSWSSTDGRTITYAPTGPNPPTVPGLAGYNWVACPFPSGGTDPVDKQFWILRKGTWRFQVNVNINPAMDNGSGVFNSYTVNLRAQPYDLRPLRTNLTNPDTIFQTYTIAGGGSTATANIFLRASCYWRMYVNVPLNLNPGFVPNSVQIAACTIVSTRA